MDIQHEQNGDEGSFFLKKAGEKVAEMQYSLVNNSTMNIYHTGVDDEMQGRHIGEKLVQTAIDYARKNNLKITPSCSFARSIFDKGNYNDVLA